MNWLADADAAALCSPHRAWSGEVNSQATNPRGFLFPLQLLILDCYFDLIAKAPHHFQCL